MLLQAENLVKTFDGITVLNDVSFEIHEGEILAIIGPNGAGKTVLFSIISGINRPTSGTIRFQGLDITGLNSHVISRRGIGRTFQFTTLFNQLRVIDNLCIGYLQHSGSGLWGAILHTSRWEREAERVRDKAMDVLDFIGLVKRADDYVSAISDLDQRRLAIGIAMASEPKMVLLDEPTGEFLEDTKDISRLIKKINDAGTTVCFIEHKMRMVMGLANRIVVLNYGSKIAEGTPKQIGINPAVAEAYLGMKEKA